MSGHRKERVATLAIAQLTVGVPTRFVTSVQTLEPRRESMNGQTRLAEGLTVLRGTSYPVGGFPQACQILVATFGIQVLQKKVPSLSAMC